MATYTGTLPNGQTATFTSPEVAAQYGVNVPTSTPASSTTIQQQENTANQALAAGGSVPHTASNPGGSYTPPTGTSVSPNGSFTASGQNPPTPTPTTTPNPATTTVVPGSSAISDTPPANLNSPAGAAYIAAHPELSSTTTTTTPQTAAAQQAAALAAAKASGAPPQDSATGSAGVNTALKNNLPPTTNTVPPNSTPSVDNFFANNKTVQQQAEDLLNFTSPQATTDELNAQLATIQTDKSTLAGLNTQLMNINTIMSGTSDDIRSEVQASNGFATESQVNAMAVARNQTLLKQATLLQNQITTQQNVVATDVSLYGDEKDLADTQFTQRSDALSMAQTNQNNIQTAAQDNAKTIITAVGYSGFVNSLLNSDPTGASLAKTEQALGMAPGTLQNVASQEKSAINLAQIQAAGTTSPYVITSNGEVVNSATGYTYTSQADFQAKTGMDTGTAGSQGLIKPLGLSIDQQTKIAQASKAQTDAQYAGAIDQANINQSNASAASSEASTNKTNADLAFEQANGGMTQADALKQGQDASNDAATYIQQLGKGTIKWNDAFNAMKSKYFPTDNSQEAINTIDNLLQAGSYRPKP